MIKYQDFAKQHRLSTLPVQPPAEPTPDAAGGSSTGGKVALAAGVLAALGGALAILAPRIREALAAIDLTPAQLGR